MMPELKTDFHERMSYTLLETARSRRRRRELKRPVGVTAIACFQILKAAVLLLTAVMLYSTPSIGFSSRSNLYTLLYVATRGNSTIISAIMQGGSAVAVMIGLWGTYLVAVGSGLWKMKEWARRSLIFTSGLTIVLYAKSILLPGILDSDRFGLSLTSPDAQNVHILLACDVAIFVYLLRGNTALSFRPRI
jgi:hypothetical protein